MSGSVRSMFPSGSDPVQQKFFDGHGINAGAYIDAETLRFSLTNADAVDSVLDTYGTQVAELLKKLAREWRERNAT